MVGLYSGKIFIFVSSVLLLPGNTQCSASLFARMDIKNSTDSPETFRVDSYPMKHWEYDNMGNLRFIAPIARSGNLVYLDRNDNEYLEYVPESTIVDSIDSFKTKPITHLHPEEKKVTTSTARQHMRGLSGYTGFFDGKFLWLTGTVVDQELIDSIVKKETSEISPGYSVVVDKIGQRQVQVKRRGNHLAAVPSGRNGRDVRFHVDSDSKEDKLLDVIYLSESWKREQLPNAPEQLYDSYRGDTSSKLFTMPLKRVDTRKMILSGLIKY